MLWNIYSINTSLHFSGKNKVLKNLSTKALTLSNIKKTASADENVSDSIFINELALPEGWPECVQSGVARLREREDTDFLQLNRTAIYVS